MLELFCPINIEQCVYDMQQLEEVSSAVDYSSKDEYELAILMNTIFIQNEWYNILIMDEIDNLNSIILNWEIDAYNIWVPKDLIDKQAELYNEEAKRLQKMIQSN